MDLEKSLILSGNSGAAYRKNTHFYELSKNEKPLFKAYYMLNSGFVLVEMRGVEPAILHGLNSIYIE